MKTQAQPNHSIAVHTIKLHDTLTVQKGCTVS